MIAPLTLTGPSEPPAGGGPARQLVILLHGLGADGNDLIGLAPILGQVLPDAAFAAPDAPFPCDMAPYGYQWFSVMDRTPAILLAAARAAARLLDAFIDDQLASLGLDDSRLALVGFSQGTMMSLHVGPRRARPPACIVGFSGRLLAPELLADEIRGRPPILLVHGDADAVVPVDSLPAAVKGLEAVGLQVSAHVAPGLGHGIDETGLRLAEEFLVAAFGPA
ncbi:MAG: phospholipase [Alphaproteobacteria bacterium]|nr:phospholipase [Alphaproteobacteria bacterium]